MFQRTGLAFSIFAMLLASRATAQELPQEEQAPPAEPDELEEPEVQPMRQPVPVPVPVPPEPATCAARAREVAADSVVRIRSGSSWGAGFVYGANNRVVTSMSLIALGQPITVVARDGTQVGARLLASDGDYDLAVLETSAPVTGARPLDPAPETSAILGRPVVAIGHPFAGISGLLGPRGQGLLRWSVAQGSIAAVNEHGVQVDMALDEGHSGAPLLDCEGRAIGMLAGAGLLGPNVGLAVRVAEIDRAIEGASGPSDFLGDLRLRFGIGGILQIDEEGRAAGGGYLVLGATLFDRVSWMNHVGLLFGGIGDPGVDELSLDRTLVRIESLLGYRFFLDIGGFTTLYIVPAGGITVNHDSRTTRSVAVTPGCTPSDTDSCIAITKSTVDEWYVRPAIGLSFLFGGAVEIGYVLEIGFERPEVETFHNVTLGVQF
jgi:hypothetical protein